eukprot:CAMPEP_0178972914 /NCGR_PEP_ID=MMETSP0789-20121207/21359_1 /TAXON_ID=3005 /ORGANISM="Rhizosolenia setigera, Strain CCMP 1694" /LENGTH=48 /DNA_ID= /DNA_START= /DNA_END= /DNA_ORIENTATION=
MSSIGLGENSSLELPEQDEIELGTSDSPSLALDAFSILYRKESCAARF